MELLLLILVVYGFLMDLFGMMLGMLEVRKVFRVYKVLKDFKVLKVFRVSKEFKVLKV